MLSDDNLFAVMVKVKLSLSKSTGHYGYTVKSPLAYIIFWKENLKTFQILLHLILLTKLNMLGKYKKSHIRIPCKSKNNQDFDYTIILMVQCYWHILINYQGNLFPTNRHLQ